MSTYAISAAKRGRQCALESFVCGSAQTRRAIRDHERADRKRGEIGAEAPRLLGYPRERRKYIELMSELQRIADREKKGKVYEMLENGMGVKYVF